MTFSEDPKDLPVDGQELATLIAGKLCHDFISPSGAIMSGLDLLDDPSAQDMRDDALDLIRQSARKLVALVQFARVAFGASTTSERFTTDELHGLVTGVVEGGRASLDWQIPSGDLDKPQARTLLNLAYLAMGALPSGGTATLTTRRDADLLVIHARSEGNRARLKPEAITGLAGHRLSEGLAGQWVQPYWLWLTISETGGMLDVTTQDGCVEIVARLSS